MNKYVYYALSILVIFSTLTMGKSGLALDTGKITIAYPSKGSTLFSYQKIRIKWTANYSPCLLHGHLYYDFNQDTTQYSVNSYILQQDSLGYYFTIPGYKGIGKIKIFDRSNSQVYAESDFFTMLPYPSIKIKSFNNGAIIKPDTRTAITFEAANTPKADIEFSTDAGSNWTYIMKDYQLDSLTLNTYSIEWQTPNIISSRFKLRISSKNGSDSCMLYVTNKETIGEFPFQTGNRWFYKYYSNSGLPSEIALSKIISMVCEINGMAVKGNNTYYQMATYWKRTDTAKGFVLYETRFLRQEKNLILEYVDNSENTICDLTQASFWTSLKYEVMFNKVYRTYSFFVYGRNNYTVCDSLGFSQLYYTESNMGTRYYWLSGCILNGVKYGETLDDVVGIDESDKNKIPTEYALCQNYPNPFNPVTTIKYSIPQSQFVTIKVYDMLGREVQTLVNEEKSAGTHQVQFNGGSLSSGTYIYRLNAGLYSEAKKFILLK